MALEQGRQTRERAVAWWENSSFFRKLWSYLAMAGVFALGQALMAWVFLSSPRLTFCFLAAELVLAGVAIVARPLASSRAMALAWCKWPLLGIYALLTGYFAFVFALGCYWFGTANGAWSALALSLALVAVHCAARYRPRWSGWAQSAASLSIMGTNAWISVKAGQASILPFALAPMFCIASAVFMVVVWREAAKPRSWDG
ncbi:hypothetical protein FE772_06020 [Lysobacter enzymogenes]|nr:hypothetical protein [Lysobacter enzymogenes]QCW25284.1 hypothetical protein FE772_06020 [Lysobacter enzymogenes]